VEPTVEVWTQSGRELRALLGDRVTVGKDPSNDLSLTDDRTVSRLHAVLERFPAGWCVTDLGSSNGTFVNGERIWAARRLRHGDEVRVGQSRLVLRDSEAAAPSVTDAEVAAPALTSRERDVLRVLCRPLLARDLFTEPASVREVATELVVSEAAVKQHLTNLYVKFEIDESATHRRARLANEALRRAAVTLADLEPPS
jgi:pSer/pThr/pTyr-binding forkhead associated (FHA) protein